MAELPRTIQVGPMTYTVSASTEELEAYRASLGRSDVTAHSDHWQQRIVVDPNLAPDAIRLAITHELTHALVSLYGLEGQPADEQFVDTLSLALLDTLRRNPALVAYLTDCHS